MSLDNNAAIERASTSSSDQAHIEARRDEYDLAEFTAAMAQAQQKADQRARLRRKAGQVNAIFSGLELLLVAVTAAAGLAELITLAAR